MRNAVAIAAIAVVATALYSAVAPAVDQSVTPAQFAALKQKVTALQKQVSQLESFKRDCLAHTIPIVLYGHPPNDGYLFRASDGNYGTVTALNAAKPQAASAFLLEVGSRCASTMRTRKLPPR